MKHRPFKGRYLRLVYVCPRERETTDKEGNTNITGLVFCLPLCFGLKLCSEMEIFAAENQRQLEQHQALQRSVFIKQEAVEHQLAVYQQRVGFMEKLLDQFKIGTASSTTAYIILLNGWQTV